MNTSASRLSRILSMADRIAGQLHDLHFASFHLPGSSWTPAINVYAFADRFEVCMDLAGVDKRQIQVQAESRRLSVTGHRVPPAGSGEEPCCKRILVMEIHDGQFARTLEFAEELDTSRVQARQENGWLWITLPKAHQEAAP